MRRLFFLLAALAVSASPGCGSSPPDPNDPMMPGDMDMRVVHLDSNATAR